MASSWWSDGSGPEATPRAASRRGRQDETSARVRGNAVEETLS